ncbi:MAG: lipoprotein [Rhodoferax sp.]|nr:lipoprotein [Rhodoferax sp.]
MLFVTKILAPATDLARAGVAPSARAALTLTVLLALSACGQKGALFLPTEPAAAQRATLVQTLSPGQAAQASTPASAASAPASTASSPAAIP